MIVLVLAGCAAGGPGTSSACACPRWRSFLSWPGRWRGWSGSRPLSKLPRGPRCWCPSPLSPQWPPGRGGLGCQDLVDGVGGPAAGLGAASPRDRGRGSWWSRSLRPAVVPPARPYPLIAPFRELRVLAVLAAAGGAGVFAVVMRGGGWGQGLGLASGRAVRFVMGGLGGCHRDW